MMNFGNSNIVLSFLDFFHKMMNGLKSGAKQLKSLTNLPKAKPFMVKRRFFSGDIQAICLSKEDKRS